MSTAIRRSLYGKMAGDTTLTGLLAQAPDGYSQSIYHQEAPDIAQYPLIVFSKSSGVPTETFHVPEALETEVWLIKAIDRNTSADTAEAIAARLNVLLNDASLSISGATLLYLRRQSDVDYPEEANGINYKHCGALYRLIAEF